MRQSDLRNGILAALLAVFTLGVVWQLATGLTLMGETWILSKLLAH